MNNTIFWYWFKRISFITSICMLMYALYTWISPEQEFHTKYTNTKIIQTIHVEGDRDIVKWSGVDNDGIKHDFEGKVYNNHIGNKCDVTLDDIKSGTVYIHKCRLFASYCVIFMILFVGSLGSLLIENDLGCQSDRELVYRLKYRIEIAKYWFIFWGYPLNKVNNAIEIYKSRCRWDNAHLLNIGLINVILSVNEIMKTN